jgi:hypothetical protein
VTLDDNIIMFVSNITTVFLNNLLRVLFPCHDTNEYRNTGIVQALPPFISPYYPPSATFSKSSVTVLFFRHGCVPLKEKNHILNGVDIHNSMLSITTFPSTVFGSKVIPYIFFITTAVRSFDKML